MQEWGGTGVGEEKSVSIFQKCSTAYLIYEKKEVVF